MEKAVIYNKSMSSYFQAIQSIQEALGKENAEQVIKALDAVFRALEDKAKEKEIHIKIEVAEQVKKELKEELKEELATKYDVLQVKNELLQVKSELKEEIADLRLEIEKRFGRLYWVLIGLGALILGTNPKLLEFLSRLLGIIPK